MIDSYRPQTLEAALDILNKFNCHIFAGGTDLMIRKRQWQGAERKFTQAIVFISHLEELRFIESDHEFYKIGTLTTQSDMVNSDLPEYIREPYRQMAHHAIRNIATVGGNIVNAASVADSLPILYALDAQVVLRSVDGTRQVKIEDFIVGKYKTLRKQNELLTHVLIPIKPFTAYFYKKLGQRKASILSKLSVFILIHEEDIRITIGAVNETVIRNRSYELDYLKTENIEQLKDNYQSLMMGTDDKRSTKDYREKVALNLIEDYLKGVQNEL